MTTRVNRSMTYTAIILVSFAFIAQVDAQGINPELYRQLEFRHIGPQGNRVIAVAGVPGDTNIYYTGAASGGIWKTFDGGIHWEPIFDDQEVSSIGALAIAPSDPNIVWAGTGENNGQRSVSYGDGVYRTDGCRKDKPSICAGYMTQENDYKGYNYPSTAIANRILGSHEFFHAVQAAYDDAQDSVAREGSAVWATERFDPSTWPKEVKGVGFTEAPRGALAHWVRIKDTKIDNYQCVVPTTWNGSPRDNEGNIGAFEAALLDTKVERAEEPVEILRTLHSFDPCLACSTHVMSEDGHELARVDVR